MSSTGRKAWLVYLYSGIGWIKDTVSKILNFYLCQLENPKHKLYKYRFSTGMSECMNNFASLFLW
jgi:hypothetical protein